MDAEDMDEEGSDEEMMDEEVLMDKEEDLQEIMGEYLAAETEQRRRSKLLRHAEKEVEQGGKRLQKWNG